MEPEAAPRRSFALRAERRIAGLTFVLGFAAAGAAVFASSLATGAGVAAGALLAWMNFRWLRQGVDALARVATTPAGGERPRISTWVYAKLFGRYALIGVVLYVMVFRLSVPAWSIVAGLLALGAAAMVESIYEVLQRKA
jgi:hypothetical protein